MRQVLTILFLLFVNLSFSQVKNEHAQIEDKTNLELLKNISYQDISKGFKIGEWYGGYYFKLDSNNMFYQIDYGCMGRNLIDTGTWRIKDNNTLIIESCKQVKYLRVFKYGIYFFYIPIDKTQDFKNDFENARKTYENNRSVVVEEVLYSSVDFTAASLFAKYYFKEMRP